MTRFDAATKLINTLQPSGPCTENNMLCVCNLSLTFCGDTQLLRCGEEDKIFMSVSLPPEKRGKGERI
jgi:hypothetical protein